MSRLERLSDRRNIVAGLEAGAAAGLAWWLGQLILGTDEPFYAPIAAVVVIGAGYVRRIERARAMVSGMGLAIVVSEIGVRLIGTGPLQIGALSALSIIAARVAFDDLLAVTYAGLNAAVLVSLGGEGWVPNRLLEGLIGAATAYALVYLVFPPRPEGHIHKAIAEHVGQATENLGLLATALRSEGEEDAVRAQRRSDRIDRNIESLAATFDFTREVSRFSPWRRGRRADTEQARDRARALHAMLRESTVLLRLGTRLADQTGPEEAHLAEAVEHLADASERAARLVTEDAYGSSSNDSRNEIDDLVERARSAVQRRCENETATLHMSVIDEFGVLTEGLGSLTADSRSEQAPSGEGRRTRQ